MAGPAERRIAKLAVDLALTLQVGEPQLSELERTALDGGAVAAGDAIETRILQVASTYDHFVSTLGWEPARALGALTLLSREGVAGFDPLVLGALKLLQPPA